MAEGFPDATSYANYRFSAPVSLLAKRRAIKMKRKVKELMDKDGICISNVMDDDLKKILKNIFSQTAHQ